MTAADLPVPKQQYRSRGPSNGTLIAVLLLLAVLPNAVAVTSPLSAALIESSIAEVRLLSGSREKPDPARERGIGRVPRDFRVLGSQHGRSTSVPGFAFAVDPHRLAQGGVLNVWRFGQVQGVAALRDDPGAAVRAGRIGLPPPRA